MPTLNELQLLAAQTLVPGLSSRSTLNEAQYAMALAIASGTISSGRVLGSSGTPVKVYGNSGAPAVNAATLTISAGTITPGSILEFDGLFTFYTPNNAGRTVVLAIGATTVWNSFPVASVGALATKAVGIVSSDLQTLYVYSQHFNDVNAPTTGQGAPFSVHTSTPVPLSIDFTADQTLTIQLAPINDDVAELTGWSLTMRAASLTPANYAPSNAIAAWGDSLTNGTGSIGAFGAQRAGTSSNGSAVVTMANTTGVAAGQNITGPGVPANTTVLSFVANTSVTMSANAGVAAGAGTFTIISGSWPAQLMYDTPGRPVANLGIGGQTSVQISARVLRDKVQGKLQTCVFWMGRNSDWTTPTGRTAIMADIAAAVGNLAQGTKYVVCNVTTAQGETTGTSNNTAIMALNALIAAAYPNNYVDIFGTTCTNNGSPVTAWLADGTAGQVHYNDLGYLQIKNAIKTKLTALGA